MANIKRFRRTRATTRVVNAFEAIKQRLSKFGKSGTLPTRAEIDSAKEMIRRRNAELAERSRHGSRTED